MIIAAGDDANISLIYDAALKFIGYIPYNEQDILNRINRTQIAIDEHRNTDNNTVCPSSVFLGNAPLIAYITRRVMRTMLKNDRGNATYIHSASDRVVILHARVSRDISTTRKGTAVEINICGRQYLATFFVVSAGAVRCFMFLLTCIIAMLCLTCRLLNIFRFLGRFYLLLLF